MRLLVSLFVVAGIASSVRADSDERVYLRGNGECSFFLQRDAITMPCSLSYLWGGDGQFKLSIADGETEPMVISATLKVELYYVTVRDDQGNHVGVGARKGRQITISFPWKKPEGQETDARVLLSNEFHEDGGKLEFIDLSGSLTFLDPLSGLLTPLGPASVITFKGRLDTDHQITACLVAGKKPADCGV